MEQLLLPIDEFEAHRFEVSIHATLLQRRAASYKFGMDFGIEFSEREYYEALDAAMAHQLRLAFPVEYFMREFEIREERELWRDWSRYP